MAKAEDHKKLQRQTPTKRPSSDGYRPRRTKWDRDLIVKAMAEIMQREPAAHRVRYWNTHAPTKDAILRFFPMVKDAVADAETLVSVGGPQYRLEELADALLTAYRALGRVPPSSYWREPGRAPTIEAFTRLCGGYRAALQSARVGDRSLWEIMCDDATPRNLSWDAHSLITMLQSERLFIGAVPPETHWQARNPCPADFQRTFGTYQNALISAGLRRLSTGDEDEFTR